MENDVNRQANKNELNKIKNQTGEDSQDVIQNPPPGQKEKSLKDPEPFSKLPPAPEQKENRK